MTSSWNRREFLSGSAAAGVGLLTAGALPAAETKTKLNKALIGAPNEETLKKWKEAGFDGIETDGGAGRSRPPRPRPPARWPRSSA